MRQLPQQAADGCLLLLLRICVRPTSCCCCWAICAAAVLLLLLLRDADHAQVRARPAAKQRRALGQRAQGAGDDGGRPLWAVHAAVHGDAVTGVSGVRRSDGRRRANWAGHGGDPRAWWVLLPQLPPSPSSSVRCVLHNGPLSGACRPHGPQVAGVCCSVPQVTTPNRARVRPGKPHWRQQFPPAGSCQAQQAQLQHRPLRANLLCKSNCCGRLSCTSIRQRLLWQAQLHQHQAAPPAAQQQHMPTAAEQQQAQPPDCCSDAAAAAPKPWQRFFLGYRERFVDDCLIPLPNGKTVRVAQAPSAGAAGGNGAGGGRKQQPAGKAQQQQPRRSKAGTGSSTGGSGGGGGRKSDPALTGTTVWDGAVVLAQYLAVADLPCLLPLQQQGPQQPPLPRQSLPRTLRPTPAQQPVQEQQQQLQQQHPPPPVQQQQQQQQRRVVSLELGAGTGAVSLALLASRRVSTALLTDLGPVLPALSANVARNAAAGVLDGGTARVGQLRWEAVAADAAALAAATGHAPPYELVVGSDLIYYSYTGATPHSRLLLAALVALAGPASTILLALSLHHNPSEVAAFLRWAAEDWGFHVADVSAQLPAEYRCDDVLVARLVLADAAKAAAAAAAAAAGTLVRNY